MEHVLAALTPQNRLACEVALHTGLRISDVLALRRADVERGLKFTVVEAKTGKRRAVTLTKDLRGRLLSGAGDLYCFPGRLDERKHRTRNAVWRDIKRAAAAFRISPRGISPHTLRKIYAVDKYHQTGDLDKVRRLLNHDWETTTMLYAFADILEARRRSAK